MLATLILCLVASLRYYAVGDFQAALPALMFRVIMLFGHFTPLCVLLLSPVLVLAMLWPHYRWILASGVLLATGIVLAVLVDTQVYQLYRFHINAGVLNLLLGGAASETFIFSRVMYVQATAIAAIVASLLTAVSVVAWRKIIRSQKRTAVPRTVGLSLATTVCAFHLVHVWADAIGHEPILEETAVLPVRYAATAKRFLRDRGWDVSVRDVAAWQGESDVSALVYPQGSLECVAPPKAPNIIFILVDSWRFDELNEEVTPRIAAFASNAMRFLDHRSGGNATRVGVFSLFYAVPGTYWHAMLRERRSPVFIDELQRLGYDIQAFRSTPITSPEFDRTVFAGVKLSRRGSDGTSPVQWDRDLTDDFLAYLERRGASTTPFFALLFYDSPHSFDVPRDRPAKFTPSASHVNHFQLHSQADPEPLRNRYRNSVHYVDGLVGEVLDSLQTRRLLDSTVVVLTGDHGQEFNDSGLNYWGHNSAYNRYQTGVPFVLHIPTLGRGAFAHRTTHFDVVPTLLRYQLGCAAPMEYFSVGRSLFDASDRHPLVLSDYADFAIVQRDRIAVVREQGLQMLGADYSEIDASLHPEVARAALEQKTRFYKRTPRNLRRRGE